MANLVGQRLGNYRLIQSVGGGGFADVYLGEHVYLQTHAAIKVLHTRLADGDVERFRQEAQIIAHLTHPHIVRVLEFGVEDTTPFLVMEYAAQGTLRKLHPRGARVPLSSIVAYTKQIASALQYAHDQKLIHRDVKPENILLGQGDSILLSDFGIAILALSSQERHEEKVVGTIAYMAPEQIRGHPKPASDQYALGVMVYEWLCGELPFRGTYLEVATQHCLAAPPPLQEKAPDIWSAIEQVVLKALAKAPEERFACVQAFAEALEQAYQEARQPHRRKFLSQAASPVAPEESPEASPARLNEHAPSSPSAPVSHWPFLARPAPLASRQHQQNRRRLLAKVRAFWITNVLEPSLRDGVVLALRLQEQPDAVAHPWPSTNRPGRPLPLGTTITRLYDQVGGELLILGDPGSGKTILLLELARELLDRAKQDDTHPLPVVFNLSSWAMKRPPLVEWLVEELHRVYQVPRPLGRSWVEANEILPLLDGLDEVAPMHRSACVDTINRYRQAYGLVPLVVCCRSVDYPAPDSLLQLGSAISIQPLTPELVDQYLSNAGGQVMPVRVALRSDLELQVLATTPLMLSILTLAYRGMPIETLLRAGSSEARRRHVFATYVQRLLQRRSGQGRYAQEQTIHWLSWLARQLLRHNQTIFYLEGMQPDWLPDSASVLRYQRLVLGLVLGLIGSQIALFVDASVTDIVYYGLFRMSVTSSLTAWLLPELLCLPIVGLVYGVVFGLIGWLSGWLIKRKEAPGVSAANPARSWRRLQRKLISALLVGGSCGVIFGLANLTWIPLPFSYWYVDSLSTRLILVLIGGGFGCLFGGLVGLEERDIKPVEALVWLQGHLIQRVIKFLVGCFAGSLAIELLWLAYIAIYHVPFHLLSIQGVFAFVLGAGIGGFLSGLSRIHGRKQIPLIPNQGIRQSVRNCLVTALPTGLVIMGVAVIASYVLREPSQPFNWLVQIEGFLLPWVLPFSLIVTLLIALTNGGYAWIQHTILRWLLYRAGSMPWNYPTFLDYAAECTFLRKVGGGYMFTHQLLMEYFASLTTTADPWRTVKSRSPRSGGKPRP